MPERPIIDSVAIRDQLLREGKKEFKTEEERLAYSSGVLDFYNTVKGIVEKEPIGAEK